MELMLLGKNPVEEKRPTGRDVKNETVFDELQSEVEKAVSILDGAGDWGKIVSLASDILASKSKNLIVAGYMGVGLVHTQKMKGLLTGTHVYLDMIETFWDDLFPVKSRPRGRSRAIDWWVEKTTLALKSIPNPQITQEESDQLCERLEKVNRFLRLNLDDCPSFHSLIEGLRFISPSFQPEPITETPISNSLRPEITQDIDQNQLLTDSDAQKSLKGVAELARKTSSYLLAQDKANPLVYRLNRISLWVDVDELPPAEDGRTLLAPPDKILLDRISLLKENDDHETLLKVAEEEAHQNIFWLDLHRLSYEALKSLEGDTTLAADTIGRDVASFVRRIPGIEALSFSDGQPFADQETINWIQGFTGGGGAVSSHVKDVSIAATSDVMKETMSQIKPLLKKRTMADAIAQFQTGLGSVSSGHEKFLWKVAFANLLLKAKQPELLSAQIEQILEDIDQFKLSEFNPALALQGMAVALKGYRQLSYSDSKQNAKNVLHRIAKTDMNEFIRIGGLS